MRYLLSGVLLLAAAAGGCGGGNGSADEELMMVTGPVFVTGDEAVPEARAVVVDAAGRILSVHERIPEMPGVRRVILPGTLALPGLHDAHLHLSGIGRLLEQVDLGGIGSPAAAARMVAEFAAAHPQARVVTGRGWDQNLFPGRTYPTWNDLQGAADRPVWLRRIDGHAGWANRVLLDELGIDAATPDPAGGRILRDAAGEPTGVLVDNAMDLVESILPEPTDADRERWLAAGCAACADIGLTAATDMGLTAADVAALDRLDAAGKLPIRVFGYLEGTEEGILDLLDHPRAGDRFRIAGVKLYADGALGSRGAALLADYADEPGNRGLLIHSPAELTRLAREVHDRGGRLAVHAIGDRGVRVVLEAFAALGPDAIGRRNRVEHAQNVHPDDFDRFVDVGATASMQPVHCTSDMGWCGDRLGPGRVAGAYAWRTMLDRGIPLAFGSDAPIESPDPLAGIHAAVTRQDAVGEPAGGWRPEQRLTEAEAIAAFTLGGARAAMAEDDLGVLAPGRIFDATLLDGDPRGGGGAWLEVSATATVVGGRLRIADGR